MDKSEIVLYQPNSTVAVEVRVVNENVWLNRQQIATLFDRDIKTIGKHINNALKEELAPNCRKFCDSWERGHRKFSCRKIDVTEDKRDGGGKRAIAEWDLRDARGRAVAEGAYLVRGKIKMADGKRDRVSVVVGVR